MDLDNVLRKAVEMGASDVHLKVPLPPVTTGERRAGALER